MRGERIEIYPDRSGEWRWRWKAANNRTTQTSGESFSSHHAAHDAAERVRASNPEVPIFEVEGPEE